MRNNKWAFLFTCIFSIIQYSGILLAVILEYLSTRKMGVARYLLYKKQEFDTTYFTDTSIHVLYILFFVGAIVCVLFLIRGKRKIPFIIAVLANLLGVVFLQLKSQLYAYHFFLIGMIVVVVLQYFFILLKKIKK
ncbi:hypothetical protein [Bacillus sp. JJ1764]|uniref:hypothetical protein n=1 Tax=Bacillus sp. JJ1764 TaxID=3122964 RepID=UPI002FFEBEF5